MGRKIRGGAVHVSSDTVTALMSSLTRIWLLWSPPLLVLSLTWTVLTVDFIYCPQFSMFQLAEHIWFADLIPCLWEMKDNVGWGLSRWECYILGNEEVSCL